MCTALTREKICAIMRIKGVFTLTETETDATTEIDNYVFNDNLQNCSHYSETETGTEIPMGYKS